MQFLKLYSLVAFFLTTTGVLAAPTTSTVSCKNFDFRESGGQSLCSPEAAYKWDGESTTVEQGHDTSSTCDHVLEISVAAQVIKTRFCPGMDNSKTLTDEEKTASLEKLKKIINAGAPPQQRNTFFFTTAAEAVKGRAVEKWVNSKGAFKAAMFVNLEKTSPNLKASYSPQKLIAVGDYLSGKTKANSVKVSNLIDNALAAEAKKGKFTLETGKSTKVTWGEFLEWYEEVVTAAEADMKAATQTSNSGQESR
ncbi:hypothetical protein K435DRAFT_875085 [Dendrothele bispora CBS 962.96]|uniref:Uncharacterized protein n=1 Tax=Dendrothele bispora (strain CBS 962.96) TaxID=1314807 RepID=A0A4S8KVE7_DENBC|nr:hypothetical protein K435DRAFT_875085 [Dendrothele bispora CBS 962.96]